MLTTKLKLSVVTIVALLTIFIACLEFSCTTTIAGSGSSTGNAFVCGSIYNEDGSPARGVRIAVHNQSFIDTVAVAKRTAAAGYVFTDNNGGYSVPLPGTGEYMLVALDNSGNGVVLQFTVEESRMIDLTADTLHACGSLNGTVHVQDTTNSAVIVVVNGMEAGAVCDMNGNFTINNIPAGTYRISMLGYRSGYSLIGSTDAVIGVNQATDLGAVTAHHTPELLQVPADYATIRDALTNANDGDTVVIDDGIWESPGWMANLRFSDSAPVTVKARNRFGVKINGGSAFQFANSANITIDGFDLSAMNNCFQLSSGCKNITLENCSIHDGASGAFLLKADNSTGLNILQCEFARPGDIGGGWHNSCISMSNVHSVQIRNCMFTGGAAYSYVKIDGAIAGLVLDGNVFRDFNGDGWQPSVIIGGLNTGLTVSDCKDIAVQNNIWSHCSTGVISIGASQNVSIFNNLILNCSTVNARSGLIQAHPTGGSITGMMIFNNIFADYDSTGRQSILTSDSATTISLQNGNNCYYYPAGMPSLGLVDPQSEQNALFSDPLVPVPNGVTFDDFVTSVQPPATSPCIDKGSNVVSSQVFAPVVKDIRGAARPLGTAPDIGPFEIR